MVPLTAELNNNDKISIGKYTLTFLDQKSEQNNINIDKADETIFVRRTEEPKKVDKAEEKPSSTPVPQPSQNQILRNFSKNKTKIIIGVLFIIVIALTFFLLGYYL
jgi:hypothetical protein